jgi:hypothetical protein
VVGGFITRTLYISTITMALLVGSAVGVAGQDEALLSPMPSLEMHSIEGSGDIVFVGTPGCQPMSDRSAGHR